MSALPQPSDLGALALATLRDVLMPALPPDMRYTAAMTARALDYALTHSDDALTLGDDAARALVAQIATGSSDICLSQLDTYLACERAKVASSPTKESSS